MSELSDRLGIIKPQLTVVGKEVFQYFISPRTSLMGLSFNLNFSYEFNKLSIKKILPMVSYTQRIPV